MTTTDSDNINPNPERQADLISTFSESLRIVPCPEVIFMKVKNLFRRKTLLYPHTIVSNEFIRNMLVSCIFAALHL